MKNSLMAVIAISIVSLFTSCAHVPGGTNLKEVATKSGLTNVTTGDGTFENYTATGYHTGLEIGLAFGLPGIGKFMEVYPVQSNEDQMVQIANAAKKDGATAMINATPPQESYLGLPFLIFGLYVDSTSGTGIKVK